MAKIKKALGCIVFSIWNYCKRKWWFFSLYE